MNEKIPNTLTVRDNKHYAFLGQYLNGKNKELRLAMTERKYTAKDSGVIYRVMNHWDKKGIIPIGVTSEGNWRKFTFAEIAWLKIVEKLRSFGVSLKNISDATTATMQWEPYDSYPIFEYYLIQSWQTDMDAYFVMWESGYGEVFSSREIEKIKIINKESSHMLLISIKEILKEMRLKNIPSPESLFPLSKKEISLVDEIRSSDSEEVSIKIDKNRDIELIQSKKKIRGKEQIESRDLLVKTQKEGIYGSLTFNFQAGEEQQAEIIKNIKLS